MRLADIMTKQVERIGPKETPVKARALMKLSRIHHLVVVEDRHVSGLLTADSLRTPEADAAATVDALMARRVVTAPPELTVRKAANLMRGSSVGALPILQRGRLVGIVTVSDLLETLGRGGERPVQKGKRWVLRDRGVRPRANRTPSPARGR